MRRALPETGITSSHRFREPERSRAGRAGLRAGGHDGKRLCATGVDGENIWSAATRRRFPPRDPTLNYGIRRSQRPTEPNPPFLLLRLANFPTL